LEIHEEAIDLASSRKDHATTLPYPIPRPIGRSPPVALNVDRPEQFHASHPLLQLSFNKIIIIISILKYGSAGLKVEFEPIF
jgi:hypothetical protein